MGKYSLLFHMKFQKIISLIFVTVFATLLPLVVPTSNAQRAKDIDVVLFYGRGCPHCASMIGFLEEIEPKYPRMNFLKYEIYFEKENIPRFQTIADAYGDGINAVPTLFIGDKSFVGFSNQLGRQIEGEIVSCMQQRCMSPLRHLDLPEEEQIMGDEPVQPSSEAIGSQDSDQQDGPTALFFEENQEVNPPVAIGMEEQANEEDRGGVIPQIHEEESEDAGLATAVTLSAVVGAAVVDAINPCAFAVLIILITTVLASGRKRRALLSGLAFSLSIFLSYFFMGLGLYSAIQASGLTHSFYIVIGVLALIIGLFNLKDYLWYGKWFVCEVPMSWRPKLKAIIRSATSVSGAFFIGFAVSLFLLPCTSGPYIVILGMLAHTTTKGHALALLALYNLIFVSPMILITCAVYFGLTTTEKAEEWRTKKLRILHLIAGLIILTLGIVMLGSVWLGYI